MKIIAHVLPGKISNWSDDNFSGFSIFENSDKKFNSSRNKFLATGTVLCTFIDTTETFPEFLIELQFNTKQRIIVLFRRLVAVILIDIIKRRAILILYENIVVKYRTLEYKRAVYIDFLLRIYTSVDLITESRLNRIY